MKRDYSVETTYPAFFHREQSPLWLAAVSEALGRAVPALSGASWCELGCGQGYGATLLAAANPGMRFVGVDIDPQHIEMARVRAKAADLDNVEFICADIATRDALDGSFDLIVCHGVFSWVGPRVRNAIAATASRHLKLGGLMALHYMSEPGGAAFRAFHAVFQAVAERPDPVAEGLALLQAMRKAKAGFFQLHPHAEGTLDRLLAEDPAYVAHEFLNAEFRPLSFAEVNANMAGNGPQWLGSAKPIENIDAISLPAETAKTIGRITDPVLRETMKDVARNQPMRYDLFGLPQAPIGDAAHLDLLRQRTWTLLPGAPEPGALRLDTIIGPVHGDAAIFGPLLTALRNGPASFQALEAIAPFAERPGLLSQALQTALWAGIVHPCIARPDPLPSRRLNRVLLQEAADGRDVPALAAPLIGSGLPVGRKVLADLQLGLGDARLRKLLCLN